MCFTERLISFIEENAENIEGLGLSGTPDAIRLIKVNKGLILYISLKGGVGENFTTLFPDEPKIVTFPENVDDVKSCASEDAIVSASLRLVKSATSHLSPCENPDSLSSTKSYSEEFDKLWKEWKSFRTRKGSKQNAYKQYTKSRKKYSAEELLKAVRNYCLDCQTNQTFTKHVERFLNAGSEFFAEFIEMDVDEIKHSPESRQDYLLEGMV